MPLLPHFSRTRSLQVLRGALKPPPIYIQIRAWVHTLFTSLLPAMLVWSAIVFGDTCPSGKGTTSGGPYTPSVTAGRAAGANGAGSTRGFGHRSARMACRPRFRWDQVSAPDPGCARTPYLAQSTKGAFRYAMVKAKWGGQGRKVSPVRCMCR